MNRHISQEKKAEVAKAFKIFFKVDEPSPTDFRGVSPLNNENSMFFGFKDGKTKEDINNLWTLFLGIFGQNNEVADLFNEMTRHQYGIKFNLTMGMYWVCPRNISRWTVRAANTLMQEAFLFPNKYRPTTNS